MDEWSPSTVEEVRETIEEVAQQAGPIIWPSKLTEPYPVLIERFGEIRQMFVVAKMPTRVVYFEDIEDEFGTATEVDGRLVDCANYSDLRLCIREAERGC
jgi:hypothetical protein